MQDSTESPDEPRLRECCKQIRVRIQRGERTAIEHILQRFPEFRVDEESVVELVLTEIEANEACGQKPDVELYSRLFPNLAQRFRRLLSIRETLNACGVAECDTHPEYPHVADDAGVSLAQAVFSDEFRQKYEVVRELGRGGMGVVYQAVDRRLGRDVAIKRLLDWQTDCEKPARILREAFAAARLQHPHIVQVYEIGESNHTPYMVMEWVKGETLDETIKQRTLSNKCAVDVMLQLTSAIEFAHSRGVIHCDLKPANILIDDSAWIKVADFGLSRSSYAVACTTGNTNQSALETIRADSTGITGTPTYMAPEQVSGKLPTVATDIYALGNLFYEVLTGRPPFRADSRNDLFEQITSAEPVPPSRIQPSVPRDLEVICLRCLDKAPEKRFPSVLELRQELERFVRGEPLLSRPISPLAKMIRLARRNPLSATLATLAAISVLLGSSGVIWQWRQATENARVASDMAINAEQRRLEADSENRRARAMREKADQNFSTAKTAIDQLARLGEEMTKDAETEAAGRKVLEEASRFYLQILGREEGNPTARLDAARMHLRSTTILNQLGRWSDAIDAGQEACRLISEATRGRTPTADETYWMLEARLELAAALRDSGQRDEAWKEFSQCTESGNMAVQRFPDQHKFKTLLSLVLLNARAVLPADKQYREIEMLHEVRLLQHQVLENHPNDHWAIQVLASALDGLAVTERKQGNLHAAAELLGEAIDLREGFIHSFEHPTDHHFFLARSHHMLASLRYSKPEQTDVEIHLDRSLELAEALIQYRPQNYGYRRLFCDSLWERTKRTWVVAPDLVTQRFIDSIESYFDLFSQWPNEHEVTYRIIRMLGEVERSVDPSVLSHAKLDHSIIRFLRRIESECFPQQLKQISLSERGLQHLVQAGLLARRLNEMTIAAKYYRPSLDIADQLVRANSLGRIQDGDQKHPTALSIELARSLAACGDADGASEILASRLSVDPQSARAKNELAWLLATISPTELRDLPRAIRLAESAINDDPERAMFWNTLGLSLARQERFSEAIDAHQKAIRLSEKPDPVDSLMISVCLDKLDHASEAAGYRVKAMKTFSELPRPSFDTVEVFRECGAI